MPEILSGYMQALRPNGGALIALGGRPRADLEYVAHGYIDQIHLHGRRACVFPRVAKPQMPT